MNAFKMNKNTKTGRSGEPVHQSTIGGPPHMKGISPTSAGPLSSFYSAGPVLSLKGLSQPKLTIGQPNDRYEQEADRVADQVMRMPEPKPSVVQRQSTCPECMEKEGNQIQAKPIAEQITPLVQRQVEEEEEEEPVQAKQFPNKSPPATAGLQNKIQSVRGGGQPLSNSVRSYFEPRFGVNFSQVRIHTDSRAVETAKSINAQAYTIGRDVIFGTGQYSPGSFPGKRLLAHELTHVIQQMGKSKETRKSPQSQMIQRTVKVVISTTGCTGDQPRTIAEAIPGAKSMVWTALAWMLSFNSEDRDRVNYLLRKNFRSDSQDVFDTVKSRLTSIYTKLSDASSGIVDFDCAPATDTECTDREGYVETATRDIHICPDFFPDTLEERRWMLIHEFAHVVGALGTPEYYHADFGEVPCDDTTSVPSSSTAVENADNYARFVWCITRRAGTILRPPVTP